jgi:hypothetical protein
MGLFCLGLAIGIVLGGGALILKDAILERRNAEEPEVENRDKKIYYTCARLFMIPNGITVDINVGHPVKVESKITKIRGNADVTIFSLHLDGNIILNSIYSRNGEEEHYNTSYIANETLGSDLIIDVISEKLDNPVKDDSEHDSTHPHTNPFI